MRSNHCRRPSNEVSLTERLLALLDQLFIQTEEHSCIVSRAHSVAADVEESGSAGFIDRVYDEYAVCLYHLLIQSSEIVFSCADHSLAHYEASGTCYAACACLEIPVKCMDEFDLCSELLALFERYSAHCIVVAVFCSERNSQNLHIVFPPAICVLQSVLY